MTDHECRELYDELLAALMTQNAVDLVREIDASVRRGIVREEEPEEGGKPVAVRVPLTGHERLSEALRLLLSAASVPLMMLPVSQLGGEAAVLQWAPDFIEQTPASVGENSLEKPVEYRIQLDESLVRLRSAAENLALLIAELESEDQ
jgi:hypothetical protein